MFKFQLYQDAKGVQYLQSTSRASFPKKIAVWLANNGFEPYRKGYRSIEPINENKLVEQLKLKPWEQKDRSVKKTTKNKVCKPITKTQAQKKPIGLAGVKGLMPIGAKPNVKFEPIKLPIKWTNLFGEIMLPVHIFLHGAGGRGKTGMALDLAEDFTKHKKYVLLASAEQINSPTLDILIDAVGIKKDNPYFFKAAHYKTEHYNPGMFDLVIIDSKDSFELKPIDFEKLKEEYPQTSFILMSQSRKDGEFAGEGKWQNVVDIMLDAYERGKMKVGEKNRYNVYGDITLFETSNEKTEKQ